MKIALNKKIGSFHLSNLAFERLIELGINCYNLVGINNLDFSTNELWIYKRKIFNNFEYSSNISEDKFRNHLLLIQVIEELKEKASNDKNGSIQIIKIPNDIKYYIYEDEMGIETLHEKHRMW